MRVAALKVLGAGLLLASCGTIFPVVKDPGMGTWRMDATRSKFSPGPAPQSLTASFEPGAEGAVRLRSEAVYPDGQVRRTEYDARPDGKDYPLRGAPGADSVNLRRVDARRIERSDKKDGNTVMNQSRVVSDDGRTMLVITKGTTATGAPLEDWIVLVKDEGSGAPAKR